MNKILFMLAAYFFLTGLYLLFAPMHFYSNVPGVSSMGPFNLHFIRDVGLVFIASGGAIAYGVQQGVKSTAVAGACWPFLHALFHLQIWAGMRGFAMDFITLSDFVGVIIPGVLALYLAYKVEEANR